MNKRYLLHCLIIILLLQTRPINAQVDTASEKLKFDLGFTRNKNINLWPVFKRVNTDSYKETQVLFPLFMKKNDLQAKSSYSHLLPVFFKSSNPSGSDFRLFSLYYPSLYRNHTENRGVHSIRLLEIAPRFSLMDIRKSDDGLYLDQNLLFFMWFRNDKRLQKSHFVEFPLSWYYRNRENSSYTFFPLFYRENKDQNIHMAVTPLYWHTSTGKFFSNTLFPFWWQKKYTDPLINEQYNIIFPFSWYYKSQQTSYYTLFPLFSYGRSLQSSYYALTPLFWHFKDEKTITNTLFPLWWQKKSTNPDINERSAVIFPFSWYFKTNGSKSYTLFPFFSFGNYSRSSYYAITPLFWHTENEKRLGNTLFPIWWSRKSTDPDHGNHTEIVFPLWWSVTSKLNHTSVLFPLYWDFKTPLEHTTTCLPFFSYGGSNSGKQRYFAITPLYWQNRNERGYSRTLLPVLRNSVHYVHGDTLTTNVVFPLWWDYSGNNFHNQLLFPVYGSFKGTGYQSFTLMPFYSVGRSKDGSKSHLAISPLFWHFEKTNSRSDLLFPLWYHNVSYSSQDTVRLHTVALLWWSIKDQRSAFQTLFPVYWHVRSPHESTRLLFPLFCFNRADDGRSRFTEFTPLFWHRHTDMLSYTTIFPVWFYKREFIGGRSVRSATLFPVWWSRSDGSSSRRILFPFLWNYKTQWYRSFTFFPLFSTGRSPDNQDRHLVITPLFWKFNTPGSSFLSVLPLFYHQKTPDYTSVTLFPLLYSGHSPDYRNKMLAVTPLFWYQRNDSMISSTLFPVWKQSRIKSGSTESRNSYLIPFWWSSTVGDEKTRVLFPLVWSFSDKNYHSFTLFPLFSSGRSTDNSNSHLALTPLIWRFTRPCAVKFTVFPLFWYKKSNGLNYHSLQPLYYYSWTASTRNFRLLWLLYTYQKESGKMVSNNFLWKTIYWNNYAGGGHEFRLLYLLVADVNKTGLTEKSIFPFYYYSKTANGDENRSWFFYFYNRSKHYIPEAKDYYLEERIFWFLRLRSNYTQLKQQGKAQYLRRHTP
ncbi:MAG: hypothetical protein NTU44_08230 [Bacteroidetes bacterium]|nr:hypothetical protein [Bacteroidota bacterium]